jgi:diguanylate cyclase (GGDEF)-like protein/putative nucleotidyltransferase with HDIG domain/PAS domain S-box-containing protein
MKRLFLINLLLYLLILPVFGQNAFDGNIIFDKHGSIMLLLDSTTGDILDANESAIDFYGYSHDTLTSMNIMDINTLSKDEIESELEAAANEKRNYFVFKHKLSNDQIRDVEVYSYPFEEGEKKYLFSIIHDITNKVIDQKNAAFNRNTIYILSFFIITILIGYVYTLALSKKKIEINSRNLKSLFDNMQEGFALNEIIFDENGKGIDYKIIDANKSFEEITGYSLDSVRGKSVKEILPQAKLKWIDEFTDVSNGGESRVFIHFNKHLNKHFSISVYSPKKGQFATIFTDITDQVLNNKRIEFLSYHDSLTELYNRRYYEEESSRLDTERNLPISLVMIDVNGLKLTNDAFGHLIGDELLKRVATILKKECRSDDIIARIGGDEFIILLPKTNNFDAKRLVTRIEKTCSEERINEIQISISMGIETKFSSDQIMRDVFKRAEDNMYKSKLNDTQEMRIKTINVIVETLQKRSEIEKNHAFRVSKISTFLAKEMGLDNELIKEVEQTALLHDIGKISTSLDILNKRDFLTEAEYEELQKHAEIGYQILKSVNEYAIISEYVLSHHERWDGKGYPRKLSGQNVPLVSRLISVAEAFEAMTSERSYRKPLTKDEAITELINNSGTQFDPQIVNVFINKVAPYI